MFKKLSLILLLALLLTGAGCLQAPDNSSAPASEQTTPATLTLKVVDKSYSTNFTENQSVYDLMVTLRDSQDFTFDGKDYGPDMGFFVQSINDKLNDTDNNLYWVFYINDQKSAAGISSTILNPNDIITWKYEPLEF